MIGQHYNSGTDDRSSFKVERRELARLLGHLNAGQSVLITGGRKLGKTVLLQQVKAYFETQKI
jgi:archaellum biogenesis ATPase FlaH